MRTRILATVIAVIGCGATAISAFGQVQNFRVTEVDPSGDEVEVTNTGGAHTTPSDHPFCHEQECLSVIPSGTSFLAGERQVFSISDAGGLDDSLSDLWLYSGAPFDDGDNIVHGMTYGGIPALHRVDLAAGEGLWPDATSFAPAPPSGMTLAWDGFGFDPKDWYIDETPTMGTADSTTPNVLPTALGADGGTQDFEDVQLGDLWTAITGWLIVDTSSTPGIYTVRAVNDVMGDTTPRGSSTQWVRIRDQDAGNVQNRAYSSTVVTAGPLNYEWTFFMNVEEAPAPGAASNPRLVMQHVDGAPQNAWGIEIDDGGVSVIVTGIGGTPASTPLYSFGPGVDVGDWVLIAIKLDFTALTVAASVNGGTPVSLPINPAGTVQLNTFRFCFRGEGTGNTSTLLLDDISLSVGPEADLDGDGDVDLADFALFGQCFAGSNNPPAGSCAPGVDADFDEDGDVDLTDFATFAQEFTGSM